MGNSASESYVRSQFVGLVFAAILALAGVPAFGQVEVCSEPAADIVSGLTTTETLEFTDSITIQDVRVHVEITHAWMGDIAIDVVSPADTMVVCKVDDTVDASADMLLTFDDSGVDHASDAWTCDCDMKVAGPGALSDMGSEDSEGDWTINVFDSTAPDDGTLDEWCVEVSGCAGVDPVTVDCEVDGDLVTISFEGEGFDTFTITDNGEELDVVNSDEDPEITETLSAGLHLIIVEAYDEDEMCSLFASCIVEIKMISVCEKPGSEISFDLMEPTESIMDPGDVVETVEDLAVTVDITHTFIADLSVTVANPDGVTTTLHAEGGGDGDDIVLYYHDLGPSPASEGYTCGCYVMPEGPGTTADLIGEDEGEWILTATDGFAGDDGTLNVWCLRFFGDEPTKGELFIRGDCSGNALFSALLDALYGMDYAFTLGPEPICLSACDSDGNGTFSALIDSIFSLSYAFLLGAEPPAPFPDCGLESLDPSETCLEGPDACL